MTQTASPRTKLKCAKDTCELLDRKKEDTENPDNLPSRKKSKSKNSKNRHGDTPDDDPVSGGQLGGRTSKTGSIKKSIKKFKKIDKEQEDGTKRKFSASTKDKEGVPKEELSTVQGQQPVKTKVVKEIEGTTKTVKDRSGSLKKLVKDKKKVKSAPMTSDQTKGEKEIAVISKKEKKEVVKKQTKKKESPIIPTEESLTRRKSSSKSREFITNDKLQQEFYFDGPKTDNDPYIDTQTEPELARDQNEEQMMGQYYPEPVPTELPKYLTKNNLDESHPDQDEPIQIPAFAMKPEPTNPPVISAPVTACASKMTTRLRRSIKSKPSQNPGQQPQQQQQQQVTTTGSSKLSKSSKTGGKSGAKISRKHSRVADGKQLGTSNVKGEEVNSSVGHGQQQNSNKQHQKSHSTTNPPNEIPAMTASSSRQGPHYYDAKQGGGTSISVKPTPSTSRKKGSILGAKASLSTDHRESNNHSLNNTTNSKGVRKKVKSGGNMEDVSSVEIFVSQQQLEAAARSHGVTNNNRNAPNIIPPNHANQDKLERGNNRGNNNQSPNNNAPSTGLPTTNANTRDSAPGRPLTGITKYTKTPLGNNNNNRPISRQQTNNNNLQGTSLAPLQGLISGSATPKNKLLLKSRGGGGQMLNQRHINVKVNRSLVGSVKSGSKSNKSSTKGPSKKDNWYFHHSHTTRDMTTDSGTLVDIRKELHDFEMIGFD